VRGGNEGVAVTHKLKTARNGKPQLSIYEVIMKYSMATLKQNIVMTNFIHKTNRLQVPGIYDGGQYYFVTILVKERACIFEIYKDNVYKSIVKSELENIPNFYDDVKLEDFVIMPNHIHAIIAINQKSKTNLSQIISTFKSVTYKKIKQQITNAVTESPSFPPMDTTILDLGDLGVAVTQKDIKTIASVMESPSFPPNVELQNNQHCGNMGVAVTIKNLIDDHNTIWHKSYHDHVIRDEAELFSIIKYIQDNPMSWELDELNPKKGDVLVAEGPRFPQNG
jgi:putative transposase